MKLSDIAHALQATVVGDEGVQIKRLVADSRQVQSGDLFFPKRGSQSDGLDFMDQVIEKKVSAIVTPKQIDQNVPQIIAERSHENLKRICQHLYDRPTQKMNVIGVTGTNGKTSTCHFIEAMLAHANQTVGYIGTTQYRWQNQQVEAKLTTPMYETLQHYFYQMQESQTKSLVMECSSHGIELGRIDDIAFDICVYTNLSHEHLDFHDNMQAYEQAKAKLFTHHLQNSPKKQKTAVINIEDKVGARWVKEKIFSNIVTYGLHDNADVYPISIETQENGMQVRLSLFGEPFEFFMPTLGTYNVLNVMAAILVCKTQNIDHSVMKQRIEMGMSVPGRLQKVDIDAPFTVIVDYAYTEDALRNILQTLTPFRKNRIITVFGCGGDRDATRRPKMGRAVYEFADQLIITTDNPRTEEPAVIIDEIVTGIQEKKDFDQKVRVIVDRKDAIKKSLQIAEPGDIVLIAGKGHETYQEIHGVRYPFDDREIVKTCWKQK